MARRNGDWLMYRNAMEDNGIFHYEVAMEAHISPYTLSRWMRENPTNARKEIVADAIKTILSKRPGTEL